MAEAQYWFKKAQANNAADVLLEKSRKKLDYLIDKERTLRSLAERKIKREQSKALEKAEEKYKRAKREEKRARNRRESETAAEQEAQNWRDIVSGIQNTGNEIRNDLRQTQQNTIDAYKHDLDTQSSNEKLAKSNYDKKIQTIYEETARKQEALKRQTAATDNYQSKEAIQSWDCERQWRADKCGDRHTEHSINTLSSAYSGDYSNAYAGTNGSAADSSGLSNEGTQVASNSVNETSKTLSGTGTEMGPLIGEALAICRPKKSNPDIWWCDGPIQKLILADDPLSVQLSAVGCGGADPANQRLALDEQSYVFFCKYGLQKSDRNIAKLYKLPGHILVKRKSYQCNKYDIGRCSSIASP